MTDLIEILDALRAANQARQLEWDWGSKITLAYRCNELCGEIGETSNILKKIERERLGIAGSRATRLHLAEELSDVVICGDLVALHQSIDLPDAIEEYRHVVVKLSNKTPSEYGCYLHSVSGYIATICAGGELFQPSDINPMKLGLTGAILHAEAIAKSFDIDLARTVPAKFNATSRKVGLKTLMEAP